MYFPVEGGAFWFTEEVGLHEVIDNATRGTKSRDQLLIRIL